MFPLPRSAHPPAWHLRDRTFNWGERTYLMGILNVTPDSFSDGGQFNQLDRALAQARHLATAVDILDIGGQSTRPNAQEISVTEELDRVIPVIEAVRVELSMPISVDTTRAVVVEAAIAAGADVVNDISGGTYDAALLATVSRLGVPLILMHRRGTPSTMQQMTDYTNLIGEISQFLAQQVGAAIAAGIPASHLMIDPGIGFAKTVDQNLELLQNLPVFQALGCPLLVGTSRKSFIGHLLNQPDPQQRVWGTAATCCAAIAGGADILRVHDGVEIQDVCRVADALWRRPLQDKK
ncbi:dihydropteroate synthase [Synechococcales cyanobacterium C]|uniref:Dihydropteroate synthase n=1 Tax=Petrachloros mirabilis ULC683 TaxID=2781853 RepID=A0A8K1ZYE3_9CYAN|nr:dihydropteroate synthase [Petrachloros mirabilis]NCJ06391.1 dihydropteroate synthase [Petrachloros mirabilis ULC683]